MEALAWGCGQVANDDSQKPNPGPPKPPSTTQPRLPGSAQQPPTPRVIATGAQPRITPTPAQQRFSDTMAAPGLTQRPITAAQAVARPVTNPPVPNDTAPQGEPSQQPNADPYLGSTIAERYRVISKLGEGGMGVVYLAEHVFIEKRVALKVLSEDFARKADLVARFMQEAKAASKIGHENIVDITDFGETASGSVFFAMEFLDGMDLAGHIKTGGAMPFERAKVIMNQICRALGAAHSKGIIHRDMKPENVYLITREGKPDFVKVLDFGIAKMSALDDGGSRLTRTGMIFGTPEYMSPEQAKGDKPDHRVDIYAAGCILYEMLTGDVPFHAETFMGVLTKHMFENPEPPSVRNPNASIAPDVEEVCLKALAKDRDQRYQTMKELAVALEACAGGDLSAAWGNEPSGVGGGLREASQTFRTAG
ncbi:MAG: serine/threonine protein kinase, partial [bacterium]|nr:serine/threonine protein kinase [bacterium]